MKRSGRRAVSPQLHIALAVMTVGSTGCAVDPVAEPHQRNIPQLASDVGAGESDDLSLDEELLLLGSRVPGFGGAYWDGNSIVVRLTDDGNPDTAAELVRERLVASGTELGFYRTAEITFQSAAYLFSQLFEWRRAIEDAGIAGLVSTDVDEVSNRVVVGVRSSYMVTQVNTLVASREWPAEAVEARVVAAPIPESDSLIGQVIPTRNGVLTTRGSTRNCTIGANVQLVGQSGSYWITASHCTEKMLGLDTPSAQTVFSQPVPTFGPQIATTDFRDPAPSSSLTNCPAGSVCRSSDAAALKYPVDTLWGGGIIALPGAGSVFPSWVWVDSLFLDQTATPPSGTLQLKVGQVSGLTGGSPLQTCITMFPDSASYQNIGGVTIPGNLAFLCQNQANYSSVAGDSGGPVFRFSSTANPAIFFGIHHASGGYYSPLASLKKDLGSMKVDLY